MKSLLLATVVLPKLFLQVHARCRSFVPSTFQNTNRYVFTSSEQTYRASSIVNCSTAPGQTAPSSVHTPTFSCSRDQCLVSTAQDWTIRLNRTISIDVNNDLTDEIFNMASRFFGDDLAKTNLNATKIYTVSQVSGCINETQAGYWAYSPTYNCVEGVLEQCITPDEPLSGTTVRVCGIETIDTARQQADAVLHFVYADGVISGSPPQNATVSGALRVGGPEGWVMANSVFVFVLATLFGCTLLS